MPPPWPRADLINNSQHHDKKMKNILFILCLPVLLSCVALHRNGDQQHAYQDKNLGIEERGEDLLRQMTLAEKIDLLGGTGFETKAIARLGIPALNMTDGPVGVRWGKSTVFPAGIAMAATWDPELIARLGSALAEETKAKGRHVILGPCVNIARLPMAGRNFEGFGEDPYLTSRLAVHYIQGVQKEHVVATVKHIAVNNQEYQRDFVDTIVDQRALNEIYLPAFKASAEEAKALAVMSAYNKLNGQYCSESEYLLQDKLKNEWGFTGLVMSDWGAVHSAIPTFTSGLDLEMPSGKYLNQENLVVAIDNGTVSHAALDDKVRRIIRVMFTIGLFDDYPYDFTTLNNEEHKKVAAEVAKAGVVLLKNNHHILPLDSNTIRSIAVIGSNAKVAQTGGGGSSLTTPFHAASPLEALRNKIGDKVKITFAQGYLLEGDNTPIESKFLFADDHGKESGLHAEYFANINLQGPPARSLTDKQVNFTWGEGPPALDFPTDNFSARWTGYIKVDKPGRYTIDVSSDDGVRLYFADELVIDEWNDHGMSTRSFTTDFAANRYYKIKLEYYENVGGAGVKLGWRRPTDDLIAEAINTAKTSDVAIVFAGTSPAYESEGFDRPDLTLPGNQDTVISEVAKANKDTIVVLNTGSPVLMDPWVNDISGLLELWFAGEESGNAIAEILLGEANPSGKLPMTFPKRWEDCSAFASYMKEDGRTTYADGIYVGYRHFEKHQLTPLFSFGFGLSYTTFAYSDLTLSAKEMERSGCLTVRFAVTNSGQVKGAEIAQLYLRDFSASVDRPDKELKRFSKIFLNPGETKFIEFEIDEKALSFFDPAKNTWVAEAGEFEALVGSASDRIELQEKFRLKE